MMASHALEWPGSVAKARAIQKQLAARVSLSPMRKVPELVAGIDVAFPERGSITRAAVVVIRLQDMAVIEQQVSELPTCLPYIPGVLSFREGPAIMDALNKLEHKPDVLMFDGQGIAHPARLGIASHLGVLLGMPSLGIAKSLYIGEHTELGPEQGAFAPLMHEGETLGYALRSRAKVKPVYVSPGNGLSHLQALELVQACCKGYRLPEPTRLADKLSKKLPI